MTENDVRVSIARVEERQNALRDDMKEQSARIDKIDANIRWVVLAVLGVVIGAVMRLVTAGSL